MLRKILFFSILFFCFTIHSAFAWTIESINKEPYPKTGVNFVFLPLNYVDKQYFLRDTEILLEGLTKTKPFDEFTDAFGVWQVKLVKEEEKVLFKETEGIPPLKVRQEFLDNISSQLKSNYKLIIIDAKGGTSCAELSSIDKLSLIILGKRRYRDSNSFAKGFLHELGHSLGLRDECLDCGEVCPPGPPNCATTKEEAERWWGDLVGKLARVNYIRGCCGNKDYIRPTIASIMNDADKSSDFGPVNERYLRGVLEIKR